MNVGQAVRALVRLFPRDWRIAHEDEFLDAVATNRSSRSTARTIYDVARCGASLHLRRTAQRVHGASASTKAVATLLAAVAWTAALWAVFGDDISPEFLATSLVVVLVPGTGVVYTIATSVNSGFATGASAAVGCTLGIVPHLTAAMVGLSGVMHAGALAFETLRWAGVAYLAYMGLNMIRSRARTAVDLDAATDRPRPSAVIRRGIVLNLLNPKLTVFFLAFLPQFLTTAPTVLDVRLATLGAVFMLITLVVFLAYAWGAAAVRERLLAAPRAVANIERAFGFVLVGFAGHLATTDS